MYVSLHLRPIPISNEHITVGQAYNFVTSGAGAYTFEASNLFHYVNADNEIVEIRADHETTSLKVAGILSADRKVASIPRSRVFGKRATFTGCSADQQTGLNAAIPAAESYAAAANKYVSGLNSATDRYSTWFGACDAGRSGTVKTHFSNIDGNDFSTFTFNCACTDDSYAYVCEYRETLGVPQLNVYIL